MNWHQSHPIQTFRAMRPPNTQGFLRRKNLIKFTVLCFDPISSHQTENKFDLENKNYVLKTFNMLPV